MIRLLFIELDSTKPWVVVAVTIQASWDSVKGLPKKILVVRPSRSAKAAEASPAAACGSYILGNEAFVFFALRRRSL
jgi:hypothetical protein